MARRHEKETKGTRRRVVFAMSGVEEKGEGGWKAWKPRVEESRNVADRQGSKAPGQLLHSVEPTYLPRLLRLGLFFLPGCESVACSVSFFFSVCLIPLERARQRYYYDHRCLRV